MLKSNKKHKYLKTEKIFEKFLNKHMPECFYPLSQHYINNEGEYVAVYALEYIIFKNDYEVNCLSEYDKNDQVNAAFRQGMAEEFGLDWINDYEEHKTNKLQQETSALRELIIPQEQ